MHTDRPNDEKEQERLDVHHHVCALILGGELFRAPVDLDHDKARILDLGTGTGIWAIEMAELPPNCHCEINDFESEWEFSKPFDFIHGRNIGGAVRDFPLLFKRAKDNLKDGGWVEFVDFVGEPFSDDGTLAKAPNIAEWIRLIDEASHKSGKRLYIAENLKQWMIDAGFTNVVEEVYKVPFNPWPKDRHLKEIGRYHQVDLEEALDAYSMALFTRYLGWTTQAVHAFLVGVRQELVDRSIHIYSKHIWVYGQKKESD
ncbi:Methyltransferase [Aspergillus sclerotialis]|uniref:Methyltransferase n=1 Tax=Aspergillus sclerotialis TaxID=2070753 RepID=A0A3A2Z6L0_9EURO|nr:Methyltransferase [Aspergillus sclerotialis]